MVRKQLYLGIEQDRKLKRLASSRRCTEAEVVREAIDQLPEAEPESEVVAELRRLGMLAPPPKLPPELQGVSREELEARWFDILAKRNKPLTLSDAVLEERASRPY